MSDRDHAQLIIANESVGERTRDSWSHGQFHPKEPFAKFAALFGQWSLIVHADGVYEPLSDAASDELREIEFDIDRLRAKLHFVESGEWVACSQLNIDGPLIDWKRA